MPFAEKIVEGWKLIKLLCGYSSLLTRVFRSFQFSAPYRTLRLLSACSNQLSYQGRQMHTLRNMRDSIDYSCVINHQVCHYSKNGMIFLEQQMTDEQTLVRTGTSWSILLIIRVKPSNQHIVMSSAASILDWRLQKWQRRRLGGTTTRRSSSWRKF